MTCSSNTGSGVGVFQLRVLPLCLIQRPPKDGQWLINEEKTCSAVVSILVAFLLD